MLQTGKVKLVLFPWVDPYVRFQGLLSALASGPADEATLWLIADIRAYAARYAQVEGADGPIRFVEIPPTPDEGNRFSVDLNPDGLDSLEGLVRSAAVSSLLPGQTALQLGFGISDWLFLPANKKFEFAEKDFQPLIDLVHSMNIVKAIPGLESVEKAVEAIIPKIIENLATLSNTDWKVVLKSLPKSLKDNHNSLLLYSGPTPTSSKWEIEPFWHHHFYRRDCCERFLCHPDHLCHRDWASGILSRKRWEALHENDFRSCGAFFAGDYTASASTSFINDTYGQFLNLVGFLQIPHHGAKNGAKTIQNMPHCHTAVVQYGTKNTYHHPTGETLGIFQKAGIQPTHVTEYAFTQYCEGYIRFTKP